MDAEQEQSIIENIDQVKTRIQQAAQRSGRVDSEIDLVAVTKQKPAVIVKTLAENGVAKIGESYLSEAVFKIDLLRDLNIEWHMIGNIQRGKEKNIARYFDVVHSVAAKKTARELDKHARSNDKVVPVYLEFNVSGESTKQGWSAGREGDIDTLLPEITEVLQYPNLDVIGLMTMAPYSTDPEQARPFFKRMREIRDQLSALFPQTHLAGLSMGMSGDFEVAIEEGATVVRIGSALVGAR